MFRESDNNSKHHTENKEREIAANEKKNFTAKICEQTINIERDRDSEKAHLNVFRCRETKYHRKNLLCF